MGRYLLIALNSPTAGEGHEAQYNDWYNNRHKSDLLSITGAKSVRRFKVLQRNRTDKDYVAVTEFESDDPSEIMRQLAEKASNFDKSNVDRTSSIFVLAEELDTREIGSSPSGAAVAADATGSTVAGREADDVGTP